MRLRKLKALSAKEWQVLLTSMVLLPCIGLALHLKGFKWTRAYLQDHVPDRPDDLTGAFTSDPQNAMRTAESIARMVSVAANNGPYRANCLKQSLATWWLLQRRGIVTDLNIGVNKKAGDFNAHAWVEFMGKTLVEADDVREQFSSFGPQ